MNSYIYSFVRTDLPVEHQLVQLAHAAYEAGKKFQDRLGISNLVLLAARDESEIQEISDYLYLEDINHVTFFEPDYNHGLTALCTEPIVDEAKRKKFRRWRLYTPA